MFRFVSGGWAVFVVRCEVCIDLLVWSLPVCTLVERDVTVTTGRVDLVVVVVVS